MLKLILKNNVNNNFRSVKVNSLKINFLMRMHDNTPSGGRSVVYDYANFLAKRGHQVTITFLADASFKLRKHNRMSSIFHVLRYVKQKKQQETITWHKIDPNVTIKTKFSYNPLTQKESDEKVIAFDYGIALHLAKFIKKFSDDYFYFIQADEKIYYDESVVRSAWKLPIHKITISSYLKEKLDSFGNNAILVQNYINTNKFYLTKTLAQREPVVSLLNHTAAYKNTKLGIQALKLVQEKRPDLGFKVIMFGNPSFDENFGFPVSYFQHASFRTLREKVYNQSAIFLSTSENEGWGLTAMEAMACGAALISTRNGGVLDFTEDKVSAVLVPSDDPELIAEEIIHLLSDDHLRVRIARAGYERVREFSFEKSALKFEAAIRQQ
ncbi:glycosyltransferase family 4 protein [Lacticaseibacillus paracasei]|uniref:glycosyltransferase family 4 protein n=1 Tax=Lacticaseibacillus paracasei TaxID=1597 RepID=UPI0021A4475D|nr:glycosyltransferase family 4 protein [Lacticaseibacillus paracasei]MCT3339047.1 glycosyltransferase [Lacticaseibacillus paracasei]